jgi:hypothetical protein
MKTIELKDLIAGLLAIILLASSIGRLDQLHDFAKAQAVKSMKGWEPHHFFPKAKGKGGSEKRHSES